RPSSCLRYYPFPDFAQVTKRCGSNNCGSADFPVGLAGTFLCRGSQSNSDDSLAGGHMKKAKIGKLPPKFTFILNPHEHIRVSKCPICRRLTHMRKFALIIYIDKWGLLALGKTC